MKIEVATKEYFQEKNIEYNEIHSLKFSFS